MINAILHKLGNKHLKLPFLQLLSLLVQNIVYLPAPLALHSLPLVRSSWAALLGSYLNGGT